jgi:N,N'-diacetyllegionaminate synthase
MKPIIIAEAGINHNGDIKIAKDLISVAFEAGADIIKFQTFRADKLVTQSATKANYQLSVTSKNETQYQMLKKLELSDEMHHELLAASQKLGIEFCSTPFDIESLDYLMNLGIERLKIPSSEITNLPYLLEVGSKSKPIILSTGMATMLEVQTAIDVLISAGAKKNSITVLQCTTEYPAPMKEVNLNAMITIREQLNISTGLSDHSNGIEVAIAAAAMGASIIEKHFTLDKNLPGPDHLASASPDELAKMIKSIRNIELAMGDGIKQPTHSEKKNILIARKSIVAASKISEGEIFNESNITIKRPGTGLSPMLYEEVIGKRSPKDFLPDDLIEI